MQVATGKSVLNGIAIGKIKIYKAPKYVIDESIISDIDGEIIKLETAVKKAIARQNGLYNRALEVAEKESAEIFKAHAIMLEDEDLKDTVKEIITGQKRTAEYAVNMAFDNMAQVFEQMDDSYMQARSADILDIKQEVLDVLLGDDSDFMPESEPIILAAEDLTPSATVKLKESLLLGIITREGSMNSHTAILSRSMNLPTIIQCKEMDDSWDGKLGVIDGYNSLVYVEPNDELLASLTTKRKEDEKKIALLQELKGKENMTIDGTTIKVYANIGGPSDIGMVQANDAEGVGLFRSEFIYLNSKDYPTEDEQFAFYKLALESLSPKLVVIRTCDLGADKTAEYMDLGKEENPALGYRAIRICLTRTDFFKTQIRALLRASAYGNLAIMFPMIISVKELNEAKQLLETCREELEQEGVKVGNYQVGIMIETPAAVFCADELAEQCDFFSIGTNDLTQYMLAIDRQNAELEPWLDTHHPAVLKAIQMTIEAGHRHGIWVGICGELGADLSLTETFLRMGIDELSVNPQSVLPLRKVIREIDLTDQTER